jgi:hypothetical protein
LDELLSIKTRFSRVFARTHHARTKARWRGDLRSRGIAVQVVDKSAGPATKKKRGSEFVVHRDFETASCHEIVNF